MMRRLATAAAPSSTGVPRSHCYTEFRQTGFMVAIEEREYRQVQAAAGRRGNPKFL